MLCCLDHKKTQKKLIIGNAHLFWNPTHDHVKFAQAHFLKEKAAEYMRKLSFFGQNMPFILCGDFNSLPLSSVMLALEGKDIFHRPFAW